VSERRPRHPHDEPGELSGDEVERRLGGGAGLRVMHVRRARVGARAQIARDTATILATAVVAVLGWQLLGGGAAGSPEDSGPPAQDTGIVIGSFDVEPTLPPVDTLGPIVNPSIGIDATPTPVPFETLGPTTLTVVVKVRNDDGGNDRASDWTVSVTGARATTATFAGSASGTKLNIDPGRTFSISTKPKTSGGYVQSLSGQCTGPVPKGLGVTCTITEDDKPVSLTVKVTVDTSGGATKAGVNVTVKQSGSVVKAFSGNQAPQTMSLDSNTKWTITTNPLTDYDRTMSPSSACSPSSSGAAEGRQLTCTITFTYNPAPTPAPTPTSEPSPSSS
jgi:hypothetical protein